MILCARRFLGANILPHLAALPVPPAFVTGAEGGAGFEELAARLLAGRR